MIEHILHLERELSSFDGYEGWVIGKASIHIEKKKGQDKTDRKKLRDTSRLAILEIQRSDMEYQGTLQVTLVLPGKDRIKNTERPVSDTEQAKYKRSIIFDQEQVDAYLE